MRKKKTNKQKQYQSRLEPAATVWEFYRFYSRLEDESHAFYSRIQECMSECGTECVCVYGSGVEKLPDALLDFGAGAAEALAAGIDEPVR